MKKVLLVSTLLTALLYAQEAQPAQEQAAPMHEPEPSVVMVQPVVVQPVVVTTGENEAQEQTSDSKEKDEHVCPVDMQEPPVKKQQRPSTYKTIRINVVGQGVAPTTTSSPAQAYALAKRAAIADAYRLLAEKVKGVRIEGSDKIKNMMVMRSEVRTFVDAVIAEAEIIETIFKDGLCEVEMELAIDPKEWNSILASR